MGIYYSGTERTAGCWAGSIQEVSVGRGHCNVTASVYPATNRGNVFIPLQYTSDELGFNNRNSGNLSSNFLRSCLCVWTQAAKRGILAPGRGRGLFSRGRGTVRGRGSRGRGRGVPVHAVVDHRPRALEISGFADSDRVDLLPHFAVSQVLCDLKKKKKVYEV